MRIVAGIVLALAVLLAGCGTPTQKLAESDRSATRAATLDPVVPKPPAPYYLGPGGGWGLAFGALGAIVTEPGREEGRNSLREFLEKNGVSIERIVLEEFEGALRASGKLPLAARGTPGAASLRLAIRQYGLSIPNGFSSDLVPILSLECEMSDASGRVVWRAGDRLLTLGNPVPAVPGEQMRNDAKAIEAAWRAAARHLSASILKEL